MGGALKIILGVLKNLKEEFGEQVVSEILKNSYLDIADFAGSATDSNDVEKLVPEDGLATL